MKTVSTTLGGKALVASFALHGVVALAVGGHAVARSVAVLAAPDVAELAAPPLEALDPPVTPAPVTAQASEHAAHAHHHTHPYPVAPDHDAIPHDPSLVHAPFAAPPAPAPAPAPALTADPAPPLHFTMTVGPSVVALPAVATAHATARGTDDHAADPIETVAGDAAIDAPARSLSPLQPAYPAAAAAAGIEAVVRVEILIDPTGAVLEARPLDHVGYGLEDAAVRALRSARFTPPRRHGHPVRVRMIWSLAFRLT